MAAAAAAAADPAAMQQQWTQQMRATLGLMAAARQRSRERVATHRRPPSPPLPRLATCAPAAAGMPYLGMPGLAGSLPMPRKRLTGKQVVAERRKEREEAKRKAAAEAARAGVRPTPSVS